MINPRYEAYRSLLKCGRDSKYSTLEINSILTSVSMDNRDKALYTRLLYGTIEKKLTLDYVIAQFSSKKISSLDINVLTLLRLGVYQILFCEKIPDRAACNESVNIAKKEFRYSSSFVNAVLRSVCRNKATLSLYPAREDDPIKYLSIRYSVNQDICEIFVRDYGVDKTESILDAMSKGESTVTLRVNTLKRTVNDLEKELLDKGIKVTRPKHSDVGLCINYNINDIESLNKGDFFVQDVASQFCVRVLDAQKGQTVIDTCACPGGKSFGIAMDMGNEGEIYSFDLHASKLSLIESSAQKLGINIIKVSEQDGRQSRPELHGKADRVLCDLPCSGFGVIKKKPELRYKDVEMTKRLPQIQYEILCASANYLKPQGYMVFSTCTMSKVENESVLARFLESNKNFKLVPFDVYGIRFQSGMVTLFPDIHDTDGFFVAKLERIN